jgi:hypothetical protein
MTYRGINYDVGTEFVRGHSSRAIWNVADVARDLAVIRDELHGTSVNLYGTDLARIRQAATLAHQAGLHVSLQLRSIDAPRGATAARVAEAARAAASLLHQGGVTLNVGCEMTLFTSGFVPGATFRSRIRNLMWVFPFLPLINLRLNRYLREVASLARAHFGGPITYGAGAWETVDWTPFDLVGVNLYRDRWNEKTYLADLRQLRRPGKPVVITEFGCSAFEGAEREGGGGWMAIDFDAVPPVVRPGRVRSEQVQASVLDELLALYAAEGIDGAYVFDFVQPALAHDPDPARDLDMAGYGLVKVPAPGPGATSITWDRKASFGVVARHYAALARSGDPA